MRATHGPTATSAPALGLRVAPRERLRRAVAAVHAHGHISYGTSTWLLVYRRKTLALWCVPSTGPWTTCTSSADVVSAERRRGPSWGASSNLDGCTLVEPGWLKCLACPRASRLPSGL